jgi:anti-repressor protein
MKNEISIFTNEEFGELSVMMIDDKPYFPATECAKVLGYTNPRKAVLDHCRKDGVTNRYSIDRLGRKQEVKHISEGNLYRLIFKSKLPTAIRFENWLMDEVLPSIRKHGAYITDELLEKVGSSMNEAQSLFRDLMESRKELKHSKAKLVLLEQNLAYHNQILQELLL